MSNDPSVSGALISGLIAAVFWPLVLRGPYWLYKRRKGSAGPFWWPWGLVIGGVTGGALFLLRLSGF